MSNLFACTASEEPFRVNGEIAEKDISFFNVRATNSMVRITTSEGPIETLPSCGHFMGWAEAPKLFAKAYERPITEWFEGTKQLPKELKAVGLDGKERDISRGAFADDVFLKLVWDGQDEEEGVRRVQDVSDQALDEVLTSAGGWVRNESKRELVLHLRRKGLARKMHDGQLRASIVASARHLGNQYSWSGRNGSELTLRLRAAQRASGSMGSFWTSTRKWGFRRTAFLGAVVGRGHGLGPPFIWAWAGLVQVLIHHGKNEAGRGSAAALGSHGRV